MRVTWPDLRKSYLQWVCARARARPRVECAHIPECTWQNVFLIAQGSSSLCLRRTYGKWEHLLSEAKGNSLMNLRPGPHLCGSICFQLISLLKGLSIKTLMFANPTLLCSEDQWSWLQTGSSFWGSTGRALGVKHCTVFPQLVYKGITHSAHLGEQPTVLINPKIVIECAFKYFQRLQQRLMFIDQLVSDRDMTPTNSILTFWGRC